jgi:hypothetical protein
MRYPFFKVAAFRTSGLPRLSLTKSNPPTRLRPSYLRPIGCERWVPNWELTKPHLISGGFV